MDAHRISLLLSIAIKASLILSLDFNQELFGVEFTPYIKYFEAGQPPPSPKSYTFENVLTMMRIVSTKFSRIVIRSVDADDAPYIKNHSYYFRSEIRARTAEAAALINRENSNKSLSVLIGAWNYGDWNDKAHYWNSEIQVAVEAAQIANSIYQGTVEGIFLANFDIDSQEWANFTLRWMSKLRSITAGSGLKIGTLEFCDGLTSNEPIGGDENKTLIWSMRKQIALESEIFICASTPLPRDAKQGAEHAFSVMRREVLDDIAEIKVIKRELDVMWLTWWPGGKNDSWNTVENFKAYWNEANQMANNYGYKVYLRWAFEFYLYEEDTRGWWKLINNSLINNVSGYVETISGKPVHFNKYKPRPANSMNSGNDFLLHVGLPILVFVVAACIIILVIIIWRRQHAKPKYLTRNDIEGFRLGISNHYEGLQTDEYSAANIPALRAPYDHDLEIPKSGITILWDQPLGEGNFGYVCKAILKIGNSRAREVAVKMTRPDCIAIALKGILSEIKILMYLGNHPNIVSICGAYTNEIEQGVVYLALELCPLGSLKNYLRQRDTANVLESVGATYQNVMPFTDLLRWSYEIACGMAHLEAKNVIHADLATRNVLLTSEKTAKITDFGLSRRLYEYSNYSKKSQEPLPWRWMAFESLKRVEFSSKSDVWSYGITLWEIFSLGDLPFPGHSWSQDFIEAVENGLRLGQPRNASDELYQEMRNCWLLFPESRPSFSEIQNRLKLLLEETENHL